MNSRNKPSGAVCKARAAKVLGKAVGEIVAPTVIADMKRQRGFVSLVRSTQDRVHPVPNIETSVTPVSSGVEGMEKRFRIERGLVIPEDTKVSVQKFQNGVKSGHKKKKVVKKITHHTKPESELGGVSIKHQPIKSPLSNRMRRRLQNFERHLARRDAKLGRW